jgi:hypothetical protein
LVDELSDFGADEVSGILASVVALSLGWVGFPCLESSKIVDCNSVRLDIAKLDDPLKLVL